MKLRNTLCAILGMGLCNSIMAQTDAIATDRPGFSNTPYTVPAKHFQLESGWMAEVLGNLGITRRVLPDLLVKAGIGHKTEVRLSTQFYRYTYAWPQGPWHPYQGIDRLDEGYAAPVLGVKRSLIQKENHLMSAQADAVFNFLSSGYGLNRFADGRRVEAQARLIYQYKSKGSYSLLHNTIYESQDNRVSMTFNNMIGVSEKTTAFIELYLNNLYSDSPVAADVIIDGGFTYLIRKNVQFDFSTGIEVTRFSAPYTARPNEPNFSNNYFFSLGLSALLH